MKMAVGTRLVRESGGSRPEYAGYEEPWHSLEMFRGR